MIEDIHREILEKVNKASPPEPPPGYKYELKVYFIEEKDDFINNEITVVCEWVLTEIKPPSE